MLCDDVVVSLIVMIGLSITKKVVIRFLSEAVDWQLAVDSRVLGEYVSHFFEKMFVFVDKLGVRVRLSHL
jgi:hypothetical protein